MKNPRTILTSGLAGCILVIVLLFLGAPVHGKAAQSHVMVFDAAGNLVSTPPRSIDPGDTIEFQVMRDKEQEKQAITKVLDDYISTLKELSKYILNLKNQGAMSARIMNPYTIFTAIRIRQLIRPTAQIHPHRLQL